MKTMRNKYFYGKEQDAWNERFGWYWYGGEQVFGYGREEAFSDAGKYAANGITSVILFGAHFRLSFFAYWDDLVRFISLLVEAFHSYGIKVIEHHSTHLTYEPPEESVWERLLKNGTRSMGGYPDFRRNALANPIMGKARLDDFAQIDGSTGKKCLSSYIHTEGKDMEWIFKHYNGNAHCFNNPDYEYIYKKHLRSLIETGIDGIMNDDVQWFGGGTACACEHCRKRFFEKTGYKLPLPDEWQEFFENYDRPDYIAWKRFKKESSAEFHFRLEEFYAELGFLPLRPAYCAEVLPFDTTCYGFEGASMLWDYIFQECCGIIKESYICFAGEAVHRYALAKRRGVPPMALMYPANRDSTYAGWALTRSWGQLYTGAGGSSVHHDGEFRTFENQHAPFYFKPEKLGDVSFYFSKKTRDLSDADAPKIFMKPLMSHIESAYISAVCCDMVFEDDGLCVLSESKRIAAVDVSVIDDEEIKRLARYAENGGELYIIGRFGEKDGSGQKRTYSDALSLLGIRSIPVESKYCGKADFNRDGNTLTLKSVRTDYCFENVLGDVFATDEGGKAIGITEQTGSGSITVFAGETGENPIQPAIWEREVTYSVPSAEEQMRAENGAFWQFVAEKRVTVIGKSTVIPTLYKVASGYAIHLVNTEGLVSTEEKRISSADPIPVYSSSPDRPFLPELTVKVNISDAESITGAVLVSPEFGGETPLEITKKDGECSMHVSADKFSGYAMIKLYS